MDRIALLERRLRRTQLLATAFFVLLVGLGAASQSKPADDLRVRRLVVVDETGTARIVLGEDPKDTQRRSRACGLTFRDTTGTERGGMGTMEDGSIVFALDAPAGVGSPMPDRAGLMVRRDGTAFFALNDNRGETAVSFSTDASNGVAFEMFGDSEDGKKREAHCRIVLDGPASRTGAKR